MMTKIILAIAALSVVFGLLGIGMQRIYKAGGEAIRAETLQVAVDKMVARDKIIAVHKTATAEDFCRELGGHTINGECE